MSTESDPKAKAEKRQISLSAFVAVELTNDLIEYRRRTIEEAKEIKNRLKNLTKNIDKLGVFANPGKAKDKKGQGGILVIKILEFTDIELGGNAEFYKDVWLDQNGKLLLIESPIMRPKSTGEMQDVKFTEATNAEYIMLYQSVLNGIGKKVGKSLPQDT